MNAAVSSVLTQFLPQPPTPRHPSIHIQTYAHPPPHNPYFSLRDSNSVYAETFSLLLLLPPHIPTCPSLKNPEPSLLIQLIRAIDMQGA